MFGLLSCLFGTRMASSLAELSYTAAGWRCTWIRELKPAACRLVEFASNNKKMRVSSFLGLPFRCGTG